MNKITVLLLLFLSIGCKKDPEKGLFSKVPSSKTHITFVNKLENTKQLNALDYMYFYDGGGVAVGDINNDGLLDLYFTANKGPNKLYLNKGNFNFEDITDKAGVAGKSDWNTGVTMADVNGDGLLDIYVCAVSGILGFKGHNELFINNGNLTFTEESAKYGLDIQSQANNAAFFDYDKDGDLDMYLLNEGKHSAESFGPASNRKLISEGNGGRLLRNDNGKFVNVSQQAGIYSGPNSYGLGISIADFNQDGWDDIYISNDFHEDDYYYINNKNGTFTEQLKKHFGKVSRFSMGNDAEDINHDGYPDIITLDMLPKNEIALKSTLSANDIAYHKIRASLGYYSQFARNMLQINNRGEYFSEIALYSGIEATDWSWAPLFADFNQDGEQDLFISNGIYGRFNDLDYLQYFTNKAVSKKMNTSRMFDQNALNLMPSGTVHNYFFKGNSNLKFEDKSDSWFNEIPTESSGAVYADLDNDGDLDLVINNYNAPASILENNTKNTTYLKIRFKTKTKNTFGIGTKVFAYNNSVLQYQQLNPTRGFQSCVAPELHFGFGTSKKIDSLVVIWPDNTSQVLKNVATNQTLLIEPKITAKQVNYSTLFKKPAAWFKQVTDTTFCNLKHTEDSFSEFTLQPLLPYSIASQGPAFAIMNDKKNENTSIFMGGASRFSAQLVTENNGKFEPVFEESFQKDAISEDVDATFFDADGDGDLDLFVVSGGDEFTPNSSNLKDRLYINNGNNQFTKSVDALPDYYTNGSVVRVSDVDHDSDLDLFIGGRVVARKFGAPAKSFLLLNNGKGKFSIAKSELTAPLGMVTDALFTDFNNDGYDDLIVVGEWMAPQFFENQKGTFKNVTKKFAQIKNLGLWQTIYPFDIDGDGETDYLLGNWGLNTRFKASEEKPLKMDIGDFNNNGIWETLVGMAKGDVYYSINDKDELDKVLGDSFKKRFKTYHSFAEQTFDQLFPTSFLKNAQLKEVTNLSSGYLENNNGKFSFKPFINELQWSPITSFLADDFNNDGKQEVLVAGNLMSVPPYNGKFDSNIGYIIESPTKVIEGTAIGLNFGNKEVKHLKIITVNNHKYLLAAVNNGNLLVYKLKK